MLEEISSVRVVLEQFVCRRVLERWTPSAQAELSRLARRMTSAAERGSTKTVCELDVRFHETLWQLADHELLLEVAAGLRGRIERFLRAANAALAPEELRQHAARARRARRAARLAATRPPWRRPCAATSSWAPSASRAPKGSAPDAPRLLTDLPRPATQQVARRHVDVRQMRPPTPARLRRPPHPAEETNG